MFYRDYDHDVSISSSEPEPLAADRLTALARQLLSGEENFLGIYDSRDVLLQLYLDDGQKIVLELLYPEASGCLQCRLQLDEAMKLLEKLPEQFGDDLLPGANYIG